MDNSARIVTMDLEDMLMSGLESVMLNALAVEWTDREDKNGG